MKQIMLYGGVCLMAAVSLTGCIDNKYDLSDIDTTTELKVKDLVLPVNIDAIHLNDIVEIKEGDQIKEITVNGKTFYAVEEEGDFSSDEIKIDPFTLTTPEIPSSIIQFGTGEFQPAAENRPSLSMDLLEPTPNIVEYTVSNVSDALISIDELYTTGIKFELTFRFDASINEVAEVDMTNFHFTLPKEFSDLKSVPAGTYDPAKGELIVPAIKAENGMAKVSITATTINLPANDAVLDYDTHSITFNIPINLDGGTITITSKNPGSQVILPQNADVILDYDLAQMDVTAVSGTVNYKLDGNDLNIDPIQLNQIPDFLSQSGTSLVLANPQIFLSLNNPVATDKIGYRMGMKLTANRDGSSQSYTPEQKVSVGYNDGVAGPYNFCISPAAPESVPAGFENPEHVLFTSLSDILKGNGIPYSIGFNLIDPEIYKQYVEKFELRTIPAVKGNWKFLAPLALVGGENGSRIVYTKDYTGWGKDCENLTINSLSLDMNVTNAIPMEAELTGYPIDKDGKQIGNVTIEGAVVPANADHTPVKIHITGEIKNLDGIRFTAVLKPTSSEPLSPDQTLVLSNVRAKITGNYTKEL